METDISLRKFIREIITEIYDQLEKGLIGQEETGANTPGTIEEQFPELQVLKEDPSMADEKNNIL
jgi:hypothetical protein